jgi:ABC-type nitrate/sulfonate/bicarbonate transport system permease component
VDARLLPPPSLVAGEIGAFLGDPRMLRHLWVTATRVFTAFVLVTPLGVALGLCLGENEYVGRALTPFVYFMASVPKSVLLPIFVLSFGISFSQKVAFGMFQALFVLAISGIAAARSVPAELVTVARAYGASRWQLYTQIYWPSMLPVLLEGLRLGMTFNITGIVFAEMYVSPDGLGHLIAGWGASFQIPELLSGIVLAAVLSIVVNETLRWYERRVGRWRASA